MKFNRLLLGDHLTLRAHLQNGLADLKRAEEVQALAALCYSCNSLSLEQVWLQTSQPEHCESTIRADGYARVDAWPWKSDVPSFRDDLDQLD